LDPGHLSGIAIILVAPGPSRAGESNAQEIIKVSELPKIESLAKSFQSAMQSLPDRLMPSYMTHPWPKGWCGESARLFAALLNDEQIHGFEYVCGWTKDGDGEDLSHAWLQRGRLIVDVCAWPAGSPGLLIISELSAWHRRFEADRPHEADFRATANRDGQRLRETLAWIHQCIDQRDDGDAE
jgi:hypothetical protein